MSRKDERMLWISLVAALVFTIAVLATLWLDSMGGCS